MSAQLPPTPLTRSQSPLPPRKLTASHRFGVIALSLAIGMAGCTPAAQQTGSTAQPEATSADAIASPSAERPDVVVTSALLCDVTRQIARDTIDLTCLMPPNQDPHVYAPTPSDRRAIETADLVLYGGYNYETDLIRIVQATQTPAPKIAVYETAVPTPLMGEPHDHDHAHEEAAAEADHDHAHEEAAAAEAEHDHAHEETEAAGAKEALTPDPHVWHDAANGVRIAETVQDQLARLLPDRAPEFEQNTTALTGQLTQINDWIKIQAATVPAAARQLVTPHNALQYFAKAYGFTIKGALDGLSTDEKPSAARLAELVDTVKASGVKAIFAETTTNPNTIEAVARSADVQVAEQPLFIEGPGGEGTPAPSYQAMLVENTCTIVDALGGRCDRSTVPPMP